LGRLTNELPENNSTRVVIERAETQKKSTEPYFAPTS